MELPKVKTGTPMPECKKPKPDLSSLRDQFAMAAMQAMISTAGAPCLFGLEGCEANTAAGAYKMADAMLLERAK
jgi:hypothetical protein